MKEKIKKFKKKKRKEVATMKQCQYNGSIVERKEKERKKEEEW